MVPFSEIGAGQETSGIFLNTGGASGTIAKGNERLDSF